MEGTPPNNGTGLFILGQHETFPPVGFEGNLSLLDVLLYFIFSQGSKPNGRHGLLGSKVSLFHEGVMFLGWKRFFFQGLALKS